MSTQYHAKYFAYQLSRTGGEGVERLGRALFDACVDLNPHQIEAALFALRSPVAKGVLLADEVGLGKTIEAGLAICQCWAERKRHILVICPASLRKQWSLELEEKFNLPTEVLDSKLYNQRQKNDYSNPFNCNKIVLCSMHFINSKSEDVKKIPWDLVVIDEAHKLRNAYRKNNTIGQTIRWATEGRKKILLTATPLQNSLQELYGLTTLIDEHLFGDISSFRTMYTSSNADLDDLKERLQQFCRRTLRRQVLEYVRYTERNLITRPFTPTDSEHNLYEAISSFLQRKDIYALPRGQRHLIVLMIRKVMASSPHAVIGTLEKILERLNKMRNAFLENNSYDTDNEELLFDDDLLAEIQEDNEDLAVELEDIGTDIIEEEIQKEKYEFELNKLEAEIQEINDYIRWANSIGVDSKTRALITALQIGIEQMDKMGAAKKAVIFTESLRTQTFLRSFLESNGYLGSVLTYSGTNNDPDTLKVYENWITLNKTSGRISGSRPIDIRTAIIDTFRDNPEKQILITTEAGAEGINLQFCSLVINFDLPWNPQRIEQRIGRCHRYGQKFDVVVINFLNEKNAADQRVYSLLEHKFNLFSGIFGASDEVLGTIKSGVDFERRVLEIYQNCRSLEEIDAAFDKLKAELDEQIQHKMKQTRQMLMEHFDEDVHERLRANLGNTKDQIDRMSRMFWELSKYILQENALFDDHDLTFFLDRPPVSHIASGRYHLISKDKSNVPGDFLYRMSHPLGEYVLDTAKSLETPIKEVQFSASTRKPRISVAQELINSSGWMLLQKLCVSSLNDQDYLLFSAITDDYKNIDHETCSKLFNCSATVLDSTSPPPMVFERVKKDAKRHSDATIAKVMEENNRYFNEARDQLDRWADDMVKSAEKELDDIKRGIRELQRQSRHAETLEEQLDYQQKIAVLEKNKRTQRNKTFEIEDEIEQKRNRFINELEHRMQQKTTVDELFIIRWHVV